MILKKIVDRLKYWYVNYNKSNIEYAKYLGVKIGDQCRIYIKDFGSEPWLITIGDKVTITAGVKFINHDGSTWLISDEKGRRQLFRRIVIGNNVFVGINSIILPGVKIGDNSVVAAGSVVAKSVPPGSVVGGNPARYIMSFEHYRKRVLENYVSNSEMDFSLSYRERIDKILDQGFKSEMPRIRSNGEN